MYLTKFRLWNASLVEQRLYHRDAFFCFLFHWAFLKNLVPVALSYPHQTLIYFFFLFSYFSCLFSLPFFFISRWHLGMGNNVPVFRQKCAQLVLWVTFLLPGIAVTFSDETSTANYAHLNFTWELIWRQLWSGTNPRSVQAGCWFAFNHLNNLWLECWTMYCSALWLSRHT